jgi:hypothetical protein
METDKPSLLRAANYSTKGTLLTQYSFGNTTIVISGLARRIVRSVNNAESLEELTNQTEPLIDGIFSQYGFLTAVYAKIQPVIEQMDPNDPDYDLFFRTREILPKLGASIMDLVENPTPNNEINEQKYQQVRVIVKELLDYIKRDGSLDTKIKLLEGEK